MNFSILLAEGEAALQYGMMVWIFAAIFAGVVAIGWVAKAMGWLYIEKAPAPVKNKGGH